MSKITVPGRSMWQAIAYAYEAAPSGDDGARMAHLVFVGNRVIGADGMKWHVGYLFDKLEVPKPLVVARESIRELLHRLEFADKISRWHGGDFLVHLDGYTVEIEYGEEKMRQKLIDVPVGHVPDKWSPPVREKAPELPSSEIHCGDVIQAAKWWQSWEKDHGRIKWTGEGPGKPVRADITHRGDIVATAFILPPTMSAAQLPLDEPLFSGSRKGPPKGQSILDLELTVTPRIVLPKDETTQPGTKVAKGRMKKGATDKEFENKIKLGKKQPTKTEKKARKKAPSIQMAVADLLAE